MAKNVKEPAADAPLPAWADELARTLALMLKNNLLHYWFSPRDAEDAAAECYRRLGEILQSTAPVAFRVKDDKLLVNDAPVSGDSPLIGFLVSHLLARDVYDFAFSRGLEFDDFRKLLCALERTPDELQAANGLAGVIADNNIRNVMVRHVVYREMTEDDVILSKRKIEDVSGVEGVHNILAFLKGAPTKPDDRVLDRVRDVASDAEKMVELILQAADVRERPADVVQGEPLANIVVGCLRRAVHALTEDATGRTPAQKKKLAQSLVLLERQLLDTMRTMAGEVDLDLMAEISGVCGAAREDLQTDALVSDYMRKRKASEQSEERVLRYMRAKGLGELAGGELQQRLVAEGMTLDGWQELVVRSGADVAGSGGTARVLDAEFSSLGQLAVLLARLENIVEQAGTVVTGEQSAKLVETAVGVRQAVDNATRETENKIRKLGDELSVPEGERLSGEVQVSADRMSRKKLRETLAEIVQELCQPLSVINCSLQMLRGRKLGEVSESQLAMVNLAQESTDRIKMLTDSLRRISGEPDTLAPDLEITSSFYR